VSIAILPVAITVTEPPKRFITSIAFTVQFTFLPRPALLPLGQLFFDCWNTLVHELEELTFQSATLFVCAERTWAPRSIFQVLLHALDLPLEI
jgi:hypothetical protein